MEPVGRRDALGELVRGFEERGVPFVVLHGHGELPAGTDSDVEVLVATDSFDRAVDYCERTFDAEESRLRNAVELAAMVGRNPGAALEDLARAPEEAVATARRRLVATGVSGRGYVGRTFDADGTELQVANHLAYESPDDGSTIRVDPAVEDAVFDGRVERGSVHVPGAPEELAHLLCRSVFDHGGDVPARYAARCDDLVDAVRRDPALEDRLREQLSRLFYRAGTLVYDLAAAGEYDAIRPRLRRYSDY